MSNEIMLTTDTYIANTLQAHYSPVLLKHAIQELRLNQFANQADLPKKIGSKAITFFRRNAADATGVQTLGEGTAISTFREVTYTPVAVTLTQYGEAARISDILTWTELFDALKDAVALMGEDCALHADGITRDVIIAGITASGYKRYAQATANWSGLAGAAAADGKATAVDFLDAATQLTLARAPKIGGSYVAIIPPQVGRDLQNDGDWIEAHKYQNARDIFKGELGELHGVRFVLATNPWREATNGAEGTYAAAGGIFASIITGQGAYGTPKLSGDSPFSPKIIVAKGADKSDPLDQIHTAGWKSFWGSAVLNSTWGVVLRSLTAFS